MNQLIILQNRPTAKDSFHKEVNCEKCLLVCLHPVFSSQKWQEKVLVKLLLPSCKNLIAEPKPEGYEAGE